MGVSYNSGAGTLWSSRNSGAVHVVSVVVDPPDDDALFTLDQAKALARVTSTQEDALITSFIRAARDKVEREAGVSLLTQTRNIYADAIRGTFTLPPGAVPLQSVLLVSYIDSAGVVHTMDPSTYIVDLAGGRIGLPSGGTWPTDLRALQPFVIRVQCGWADRDQIPPLLLQATGLLIAHYMTLGRDLASVDMVNEMPQGYCAAIQQFEPLILA